MTSTKSWRLRLFAVLFDLAVLGDRAAKGLLYLAAGTLRIAEIQNLLKPDWQTFNNHDEDVLEGLMWWERSVYDRFLNTGDRVLVVGAGSGRDVLALAERGHDVVGLDPSPELIAIAKRVVGARGGSADLIEGFIEDAALPGAFDVIIFSYYCYSCIPDGSRRVASLDRARHHLNRDGRIIVSYLAAPSPLRQRAAGLARFSSRLSRSDWHPEQNDILQRGGVDGRMLHFEHVFTAEAFEQEARAAGLRVAYHRRWPEVPMAVLTAGDVAGEMAPVAAAGAAAMSRA